MRASFYCCCLVLLFAGSAAAQDISGTWTGKYSYLLFAGNPNKVVAEIFLHDDSLISGATHLYYGRGHYEHYTIKGVFHAAAGTVEFTEDSTIGVNLGFGEENCRGDYKMKLSVFDTALRMDGRWTTREDEVNECPATGAWFVKPLKTKKQPQTAMPARKTNIESLLEISAAEQDSIRIELLDNAEIDGDVVSLYANDQLLISKLRLGREPAVYYVSVDKATPIVLLHMVAESMGSTPPCTALMRVITNRHQYEVTLSSNYSDNGVVELFLKE